MYAFCFILLIHHWWKHRPEGEDPLFGIDRWFQKSDICNFKTCRHEMWIIVIGIAGTICLVLGGQGI